MKGEEIKSIVIKMSESEVNAKLMELSETFKPIDNRPFLSLYGDSTLTSSIKKSYLLMVWKLKIYVDSEHNPKVAEDLGYTDMFVHKYTTK